MLTNPKYFASDLAFNPSLDNLGNLSIVTDKDAIRQSLYNILMTRQGSKIMNPIFGVGIEQFLFEPLSGETASAIITKFTQQIGYFEKRITLSNQPKILIIEGTTAPGYEIDIDYTIKKYQVLDKFDIKLTKLNK
jgi:phage baseplate assembly protein W